MKYNLSADVLLTDTGEASRVGFFKTTTNLGSVFTSSDITIRSGSNTCDDVYARVLVRLHLKCSSLLLNMFIKNFISVFIPFTMRFREELAVLHDMCKSLVGNIINKPTVPI